MSRCAGVISGNVILLCLLIAVSVQPPNRRVQSTPLRGPEIVAILKADFGWMAALIYRCGAADAQHVRPPCQRLLPPQSFRSYGIICFCSVSTPRASQHQ